MATFFLSFCELNSQPDESMRKGMQHLLHMRRYLEWVSNCLLHNVFMECWRSTGLELCADLAIIICEGDTMQPLLLCSLSISERFRPSGIHFMVML